MGSVRRSTIALLALLALAAAALVHAQAAPTPLSAANDIVGPPVFESHVPANDIAGMRILSWNVNVGAGRLETLLPRLLEEAAADGLGLTILLQETFRTGDAVPELYP